MVSAAFKYVPQPAVTTLAFSSVFILLLWFDCNIPNTHTPPPLRHCTEWNIIKKQGFYSSDLLNERNAEAGSEDEEDERRGSIPNNGSRRGSKLAEILKYQVCL